MNEFTIDPGMTLRYESLLAVLLEHENHALTVERRVTDSGAFEVWLKCSMAQCEDNEGLIFVPIERCEQRISLSFQVRSWFPGEMPDATELANGIDDGLSKEWHDPDSGDAWWVDQIRADHTHPDEN